MDVSYRRDKDHNYMILDAPGELTGEEYQVRMLDWKSYSSFIKMQSPDDGRKSGLFL